MFTLRQLTAILLFSLLIANVEARDLIRIVGSDDALQLTQVVAERFAFSSGYEAPSLEVTGAGVGFQTFCAGVGFEYPDINVTSRKISQSEFNLCQQHGVDNISEIKIGRDVIVLVNSAESTRYEFTTTQIFKALAEEVEFEGKLIKNPYANWNDISPKLPKFPIQVMGPGPNTATFDAFIELVMEAGCQHFPTVKALDKNQRLRVCRTLRKDGVYIEGTRDEKSMINWLRKNTNAFGIARYVLVKENSLSIAVNSVNGILPTSKTIGNGAYILSRPILLYVKVPHIKAIPGLQNFLYEVTSERTISPRGYLADRGFFPLDDRGRNRARDNALSLAPIYR